MCLSTIKNKNPKTLPKSVICWKVFSRSRRHGAMHGWFHGFRTRFVMGKTYFDKRPKTENISSEQFTRSGLKRRVYPTGYHAFADSKSGIFIMEEGDILLKVRLSQIVAIGRECGGGVTYVGRRMYIFPKKDQPR